jgi:sialidase-1
MALEPFCEQSVVFASGQEGFHTFRIPALITTPSGALLAFCEGRKSSMSDTGEIHLLLKRSLDGGETWQPTQTVAADGPNTVGNPCPVIDRDSGTVWLPLTHNLGDDTEREIIDRTGRGTRSVWVTRSEDDGVTWTAPSDITAAVKSRDWTWYATGPGVGIQLRTGRMVIPCDYIEAGSERFFSHAIYSDDGGATWQRGGSAGEGTNECQVVERRDGSLLLNMRNYHESQTNRRATAASTDGGMTWGPLRYDAALIEPICQASFLRYTLSPPHTRDRLLFSNPASHERVHMTVRLSYDEGETWPVARRLCSGPAAYSCLAVLPDMTIGCLYECGDSHPYETIALARFNLAWLTDGADREP